MATTLTVEVHPTPTVPQQIIAQPVVAQPIMFIDKHKMLGRFLRLALPRFFGALGEDTLSF